MNQLVQHLEALIFASPNPLRRDDIKKVLEETFETKFKKGEVDKGLDALQEKFAAEDSAIELLEIAGGFQFLTKAAFHSTIGTYLKQTTKKRLSRAALETLSIIAYKQPVTKGDCEKIRGVSCDYSIQKLLEKELVSILGRAEAPGKPLLYGTSDKFMDYFGLKDLGDMPKIKDFKVPDESIGEQAPIEEEVPIDATPKPKLDLTDIVSNIVADFD